MTSPWHRSRLFWSGLAGLAMLLTAWVGLNTWVVHAEYTIRGITIGIGKDPSSIHLVYSDSTNPSYPGHAPEPGFHWRSPHELELPFLETFGAPYDYGSFHPGHGILHIGIWLIGGSCLVIWLGTMTWWFLRKKRRAQPLATAAAHLQSGQREMADK